MNDHSYDHIGKAGIVLLLLTVSDKLLAVAREIIVAGRFGISSQLDVFNLAWAVPCIICLFFSGAITGAFVPLYVQWSHTRGMQEVQNACRLVLWGVTTLCAVITGLLALVAPFLFPMLGYGLPAVLHDFGITATRLLALLVVFDGAGMVLAALLQAEKRFVSLQTAPLCVNVVIIIVLLAAYERMGIVALIIGVLAGTLCKTLFMATVLQRSGFSLFKRPSADSAAARMFVMLALPLLGSELIVNVNFLVDQIMASTLAVGSISTLKYAYRVYDVPVQIIIIALARALFPFVSEAALNKHRDDMRRMFHHSIIFLGIVTAPMICAGCLFAHDMVRLLFERGAFDGAATHQTAQTFVCYTVGLFFYAYAFINGTFFSALQATTVLFRMGCLSVIVNIVLNSVFMRFMGVQGIALSTSVTGGLISSLFILLIIRRLGITDMGRVFRALMRISAAAGCMGVVGFVVDRLAAALLLADILRLCCAGGVSICIYAGSLWLLRTPEIESYVGFFKRLLKT